MLFVSPECFKHFYVSVHWDTTFDLSRKRLWEMLKLGLSMEFIPGHVPLACVDLDVIRDYLLGLNVGIQPTFDIFLVALERVHCSIIRYTKLECSKLIPYRPRAFSAPSRLKEIHSFESFDSVCSVVPELTSDMDVT